MTGWVGVQLGGLAGLASSGGSFYYHGSLAVAGLSPPLGPERGGTRAAVAMARHRQVCARAGRVAKPAFK